MKYYCYFFVIISSFTFGQISSTIEVAYTYSIQIEGAPNMRVINSKLISNGEKSLFELDLLNQPDFFDEEDTNDGATIINLRSSKNPITYKDYLTNSLFSTERIFMKTYTVKDSLSIFEWELKDEYKTILTYNCQKAILEYRGRSYVAYFTTEIPFSVGPWKFNGLPGTILEIKESNNVLQIVANEIKLSKKGLTILNPYTDNKTIIWEEYLKRYRKKYYQLQGYKDENGTSMSMPKKNIEVLIED